MSEETADKEEEGPAPEEPKSGEQKAEPEPTPEQRLEAAREDALRNKEKMLRVAADFENFRKRTSREMDDVKRRSRQGTVKELLPVFDNLERATATEGADAASMQQGLRMVMKMFLDTLRRMGVERIDTIGKPFDPLLHESIQYEHSADREAGLVMAEVQPGYRMGDELLRPSMVVVSKGPEPVAAPPADDGAASPADAPADGANGAAETLPAPDVRDDPAAPDGDPPAS